MKYLAQRVHSSETSIFAEMTALAIQHKSVNLGQGFPSMPCAQFIKDLATEAINQNYNQYAHGLGFPPLRETLAKFYNPLFQRELNPNSEILVTVGATEALFSTCQAFIDQGDEAILFEPFYDSYPPAIEMAGGKPVYVPLIPQQDGSWQFDPQTLEQAFNEKTKLIFINTPHNPTGKIFNEQELQQIANLCKKYDTLVVADEVYEFMIFENANHNRMANISDMWERTITISSAGKTFGVTGWKIGWIIASSKWTNAINRARQWITFCAAAPLQYAIAKAIQQAPEHNFFENLVQEYQTKRDLLCKHLEENGLKVSKPKGTYFIMANHSEFGFANDREFCQYLTKEIGVTSIPPSSFYCKEHRELAKDFSRFCFCKDEDILNEAGERLKKLKNR